MAAIALLPLLALVAGCRTPVGVRVVDEATVQRTLTANVLSTGEPGVAARQVLLRLGLSERFAADPEGTLEELHQHAVEEMAEDELYALAEYSFYYALQQRSRPYYIAASLYAYAYLFPEDGSPKPDPVDPRLRTAVDIYNRAIARALVSEKGKVSFRAGSFPFPLGTLELAIEGEGFEWADRTLNQFVSAAELQVRGLRNRYRRMGIGAPFVARAAAEEGAPVPIKNARLLDPVTVPVTFFLRFGDARRALRTGNVPATLELYVESERTTIEVAGQVVPLESEPSSALAYALEGSELWAFGIRAFRHGDAVGTDDGLFMLRPYRPGRIPIVLIHGTASSPVRWAELLNELESDPRITAKYQFWFFIYSTGNPILFSASLLRDSLRQSVEELDPRGEDPALHNMVLIGHSQGGLLAKLMVVSSGDRFWDSVSDKPFDAIEMQPETRELLSSALFFEPLPFVRQAVFIATPHRGSFAAGGWLGRLGARLFRAPQELLAASTDLALSGFEAAGSAVETARTGESTRGGEGARVRRRVRRISSSVDDMEPNSPFVQALSGVRVDPRVRAYSIIPVRGGPPPEGQNDGVVAFESARLPSAVSEYVVFHSGHSTQSDPLTIREVRRILLESSPTR